MELNEIESIKAFHSIGKLAEALSKAQAEIETPKKNQSVKWFDTKLNKEVVKYRYADLADVIEASRKPLSKNNLAIIHQLEYVLSGYGLRTSLIHSSGESATTWYPLPDPSKIKAQDFGAALTYARRYSLSSILGIASEDDTDGQDAPPPEPPKKTYPQNPPSNPQPYQKPPPKLPPEKVDADLDAYLNQSHPEDAPVKSKLQMLYDFVEENAVPTDIVKGYIKQITGSVKPSSALTDFEVDVLLTKIKTNLK